MAAARLPPPSWSAAGHPEALNRVTVQRGTALSGPGFARAALQNVSHPIMSKRAKSFRAAALLKAFSLPMSPRSQLNLARYVEKIVEHRLGR